MKALTVRQPWAWAIAAGVKTVENRTRGTHYRGPLAIHAGKGWSRRGGLSQLIREDWARLVAELHEDGDPLALELAGAMFAAGEVVAVAQLVDSHVARPALESDVPGLWSAACCLDRYAEFEVYSLDARDPFRDVVHLVLEDVVQLDDPVPCRGALGFWNLPADVAAAVEAELLAIAGVA